MLKIKTITEWVKKMGILNLLKKVFSKNKKIIILGLDNSGKSTLVSFLQTGTFIDHTPTMGKQQSTMDVQGVRIDLVDMGGQKDFRSLWLGEMSDAECVIYMLDAHAIDRFNEAKQELWKLAKVLKNKPLIILANKFDLHPVASVQEIISEFDLMKLPSFEVIPVSCKTGFGIVNGFSKIYYKLTGNQISKSLKPKALTIFDQGGIPLSSKEGESSNSEILRGGLFSAITSFIRESFNSELNQLKLEGNIIIVKKSKNFMGSLVLDDVSNLDLNEAELGLKELLDHLENMCPEVRNNQLDPEKVDFLVKQYSTNLFA